jgi:hypothetical protein
MSKIKWSFIPGYDAAYEVSSAGEVRSTPRTEILKDRWGGIAERRREGRTLATHVTADGYVQVRLSYKGKATTHRLSRIVLTAFKGVAPDKEAAHLDHDKLNNSLRNLRWVSRAVNDKQKTVSGRRPESTRGVLDANDVQRVRKLLRAGWTNTAIADVFSVHHSTISCIRTGKTWAHLK